MQKNNTNNSYRQELKTRILDTSMQLFVARGIRGVKMDDIAQRLGISKRTLYEIYDNKEQLLYEGVVKRLEMRAREMQEFAEKAANEMEIVVEVVRRNLEELTSVNPLFFSDLENYQAVMKYIRSMHEQRHQQSLDFMRQGVEHGYFLKGINYEILSLLGDATSEYVMRSRMYDRFSLSEIFASFVCVQLRGLCTEKGLRALEDLFPGQ